MAKKQPLRCTDNSLKGNCFLRGRGAGWGGRGKRSCLGVFRGCWKTFHSAHVCVRACKISRENFCLLQLGLLGLSLAGEAGGLPAGAFGRLLHPGRSQPGRPLLCFLSPGSSRLGRVTWAPSLSSTVSGLVPSPSVHSFVRPLIHSKLPPA